MIIFIKNPSIVSIALDSDDLSDFLEKMKVKGFNIVSAYAEDSLLFICNGKVTDLFYFFQRFTSLSLDQPIFSCKKYSLNYDHILGIYFFHYLFSEECSSIENIEFKLVEKYLTMTTSDKKSNMIENLKLKISVLDLMIKVFKEVFDDFEESLISNSSWDISSLPDWCIKDLTEIFKPNLQIDELVYAVFEYYYETTSRLTSDRNRYSQYFSLLNSSESLILSGTLDSLRLAIRSLDISNIEQSALSSGAGCDSDKFHMLFLNCKLDNSSLDKLSQYVLVSRVESLDFSFIEADPSTLIKSNAAEILLQYNF